MSSGGRREGAGRKALHPEGKKRVQISALVAPETYEILRRLKADGVSYGAAIDSAVKAAEGNG